MSVFRNTVLRLHPFTPSCYLFLTVDAKPDTESMKRNMPPKPKRAKGKVCYMDTNPRVVLRPLMADPSGQYRSHFTTNPPTEALFNKPEFSDIKLRVGSDYYYAHKVILCAASEVFAKMLSTDWADCKNNELVIHEEGDCAKVFDRFLYFFYSGSIIISESYVIPLFTLADKYDVKSVYEECIKIIEKGLKVYVVESRPSEPSTSGLDLMSRRASHIKFSPSTSSSSSSSDDSSSSDAFDSDDSTSQDNGFPDAASAPPMSPSKNNAGSSRTLSLIGSETFPVSLVIKMMNMWHNQRISTAALYNLEARLGNQISQENFVTWNSLKEDLVIQMLGDANFCYGENVLYQAAKAWLLHDDARRDLVSKVLGQIRYPLLQPKELYEVEKDALVQSCQPVAKLIQEAMRYQLFQHCCSEDDRSKWLGTQFQTRKPRLA